MNAFWGKKQKSEQYFISKPTLQIYDSMTPKKWSKQVKALINTMKSFIIYYELF